MWWKSLKQKLQNGPGAKMNLMNAWHVLLGLWTSLLVHSTVQVSKFQLFKQVMPVTNPTTTSSAARHNAVSGVLRYNIFVLVSVSFSFFLTRRPRKSRHNLSRSERAKVRILHEWGLNYVDIAVEVDCTPQTVGSILHNYTIAAAGDDPERDYDHVDEAFKKKYPPLPLTRSPSVCACSIIRPNNILILDIKGRTC
jgi:hypothetical protein